MSTPFPEDSRKYRLDLSYEGTAYHGWQMQKEVPTIQGEVQAAVREVFQEKINVLGASRTDAGVHALHQVAHFRARTDRSPSTVRSGTNHHLPGPISVLDVSIVPDSFHASSSSRAKSYLYVILNTSVRPSLQRNFLHWIPTRLDVDNMKRAAGPLTGSGDYRAFATRAKQEEDPICTVSKIDIHQKTPYIVMLFNGNRFLHNMVRAMAGTLYEAGKGERSPEDMKRLRTSRDRTRAGPVLDASGLFLARVHYKSLANVSASAEDFLSELFLPDMPPGDWN